MKESNMRAKQLQLLGFMMTGSGAIITLAFPTILNFIITSLLVIDEDGIVTGITYNVWKEPPAGIPINVYIWSLENPKEFMSGQKARLKQMGPYVY